MKTLSVFAAGLRAGLAGLCLLLAKAPEAPCGEQGPMRRNIVYFEAGGNTGLGANYERLLSRHASLRFGVGVFPLNEGGVATVVCMPNLLVGSAPHQLEAGVGAAVAWESSGRSYVRPAAAVGYRHGASSGLFFRAGVALEYSDSRLWVTPGVSIGKSF